MESELIRTLLLLLAVFGLGSVNALVLARGLPQVALAYTAFWQLVGVIVPARLRDLFNPGTPLAAALKRHNVDPAIADAFAEFSADQIERIAKPYLPEEAKPQAE